MNEKPGLFMRRTLTGLAPTDVATDTALRKFELGDVVQVTIRRTRNLAQHRLYWAMCGLVAINHETLQDAESVHQAIKLLAGWTDKVAMRSTGEIIQVPRSIAFSKMNADEWDEYFRRAKDVVCEHLLPGVQLRELQEEILRVAI